MKTLTFLMICSMMTATVAAQDLEDNISAYKSPNGSLYLQPLADAFGANMNCGWYRSAKIDRFGLHFEIGLKAMGAFITDEQKTFTAVPEEGWNPPPGTELPTVFGEEDDVAIEGTDFPGGLWDTNIFPTLVPQITVGSVLGTEAVLRWIDYRVNEDIGNISLWGMGFRHNLSQYVPLLPVDIAVAYFWQNFKVGDVVEASTWYAGLQASINVSVICFYGGVGIESSTLDISYTIEEEDLNVSFELEGKSTSRITLGICFDLPVLKIHADYNIGKQNTASAGVSLGF